MLLFSCIHLSSPTTGVAGTRGEGGGGGGLSLLTGPFAVSFFSWFVLSDHLCCWNRPEAGQLSLILLALLPIILFHLSHTRTSSLSSFLCLFFLFPLYHIRNIPSTNQQQLGSSQPSKPVNTSRQMSLSLSILAPVPPCLFVPVSISLLEYVCNHPIKVNASQKRTKPTFLQLPPA